MLNSPSRCRVGDNTKAFPSYYGTATAAAITKDLAAAAGKCWCLGVGGLIFSYNNGTFATGTINIYSGVDSGTLVLRHSFDVSAAGLAPVPFLKVLKFPVGEMVRIQMTSGGTGVAGKLNLTDYWTESDSDPCA
jgi:hypothetical protein